MGRQEPAWLRTSRARPLPSAKMRCSTLAKSALDMAPPLLGPAAALGSFPLPSPVPLPGPTTSAGGLPLPCTEGPAASSPRIGQGIDWLLLECARRRGAQQVQTHFSEAQSFPVAAPAASMGSLVLPCSPACSRPGRRQPVHLNRLPGQLGTVLSAGQLACTGARSPRQQLPRCGCKPEQGLVLHSSSNRSAWKHVACCRAHSTRSAQQLTWSSSSSSLSSVPLLPLLPSLLLPDCSDALLAAGAAGWSGAACCLAACARVGKGFRGDSISRQRHACCQRPMHVRMAGTCPTCHAPKAARSCAGCRHLHVGAARAGHGCIGDAPWCPCRRSASRRPCSSPSCAACGPAPGRWAAASWPPAHTPAALTMLWPGTCCGRTCSTHWRDREGGLQLSSLLRKTQSPAPDSAFPGQATAF